MTIPFQSVGLLPGGPQPGPIGASPADEAQAAPFPRVSTSHARVTLAGKDTSLAGLPASFLSQDPWLAAWRESQHGPGYDMNEEVR